MPESGGILTITGKFGDPYGNRTRVSAVKGLLQVPVNVRRCHRSLSKT